MEKKKPGKDEFIMAISEALGCDNPLQCSDIWNRARDGKRVLPAAWEPLVLNALGLHNRAALQEKYPAMRFKGDAATCRFAVELEVSESYDLEDHTVLAADLPRFIDAYWKFKAFGVPIRMRLIPLDD